MPCHPASSNSRIRAAAISTGDEQLDTEIGDACQDRFFRREIMNLHMLDFGVDTMSAQVQRDVGAGLGTVAGHGRPGIDARNMHHFRTHEDRQGVMHCACGFTACVPGDHDPLADIASRADNATGAAAAARKELRAVATIGTVSVNLTGRRFAGGFGRSR